MERARRMLELAARTERRGRPREALSNGMAAAVVARSPRGTGGGRGAGLFSATSARLPAATRPSDVDSCPCRAATASRSCQISRKTAIRVDRYLCSRSPIGPAGRMALAPGPSEPDGSRSWSLGPDLSPHSVKMHGSFDESTYMELWILRNMEFLRTHKGSQPLNTKNTRSKEMAKNVYQ